MDQVRLKEIIAPAFYEVHKAIKRRAYTYYWLSGGRGSTKSSFISIEIVKGIMEDPNANAVVLRKVKETLRESVHEQLQWAIQALGVEEYWEESVSPLSLTYVPTGQRIVYRGADKPKRIKGIKFSKGYAKFLWYEELDEFNGMHEIRLINQSLLRGGTDAMVFYSYNPPISGSNWVNVEKVKTVEGRLVHHSDYTTVPEDWLGKQFLMEARQLMEDNKTAYEHEYLGLAVGTGGQVFKNVTIRRITDDEIYGNTELETPGFWNIKRAVDFGFSVDPLSYGTMHLDKKNKRLFIYHEFYGTDISNTRLVEHIKAENKDNDFVTCDSAEPKSISELRQHGLKILAAKKGPDSVDYGVKYLQDLREIVIDDVRCPNTADEFLRYEYERDKTTLEWKNGYPDRHNHSIDMTRYALNQEIMRHREMKTRKRPKNKEDYTPHDKHEVAREHLVGKMPNVSKVFNTWN